MSTHLARTRTAPDGMAAVGLVVLGWIGVMGLLVVAVAVPAVVAGLWVLNVAMGR